MNKHTLNYFPMITLLTVSLYAQSHSLMAEIPRPFVGQKVIKDDNSLNTILQQLNLDPFPVNFNEEDVIVVVGDPQPTAGYSISLVLIEVDENKPVPIRIITYSVIPPMAGSVNAAVLTTPYMMKAIPKFNGKTFFKRI